MSWNFQDSVLKNSGQLFVLENSRHCPENFRTKIRQSQFSEYFTNRVISPYDSTKKTGPGLVITGWNRSIKGTVHLDYRAPRLPDTAANEHRNSKLWKDISEKTASSVIEKPCVICHHYRILLYFCAVPYLYGLLLMIIIDMIGIDGLDGIKSVWEIYCALKKKKNLRVRICLLTVRLNQIF